MNTPDELDPADAARLRAAAQRLPAEVEPERDLWPDIRARIDQARIQALPGASGMPVARPLPWYAAPRRLAAAAVLLVSLTATATWWATRSGGSTTAPADPSAALATFDADERSAAALSAALEGRRAKLDPATLAVLERTLRTIDGAIAEAREALANDPTNPAVRAFVATAYRQKIDFLRRANDVAAELGS
jgi:hypothetical protein